MAASPRPGADYCTGLRGSDLEVETMPARIVWNAIRSMSMCALPEAEGSATAVQALPYRKR